MERGAWESLRSLAYVVPAFFIFCVRGSAILGTGMDRYSADAFVPSFNNCFMAQAESTNNESWPTRCRALGPGVSHNAQGTSQ